MSTVNIAYEPEVITPQWGDAPISIDFPDGTQVRVIALLGVEGNKPRVVIHAPADTYVTTEYLSLHDGASSTWVDVTPIPAAKAS